MLRRKIQEDPGSSLRQERKRTLISVKFSGAEVLMLGAVLVLILRVVLDRKGQELYLSVKY